MEHCSQKPGDEKEIPEFGPNSIEIAMRTRLRETIGQTAHEVNPDDETAEPSLPFS